MDGATLKNSLAEIGEDTLVRLSGIRGPTFDSDPEITHEEVFDISATAPGMIGLDVPVVGPLSSGENVRAPKADVDFPVRVPLRAGRWCHLLHLLPGIAGSCETGRSEYTDAQQA